MAFFEQIGRRITDAGQGVAQQTKNLTEIARLSAKVSENKKKMSQILFEMGQDYYLKHKRDTDNEEQEYINRINLLFQEVIAFQDEIEKIKTADVCKVCGSRIAEGSCFCMSCGARLDSTAIESNLLAASNSVRQCPNCGAPVDDGSTFCTSCGSKIDDTDDGYTDVAQEEPQHSIRICSACGTEASDADMFCANCGSKL